MSGIGGLAQGEQGIIKIEGATTCVGSANVSFTYNAYEPLSLDEIGGVDVSTGSTTNADPISFVKCFPDYASWDSYALSEDFGGVEGVLEDGGDAEVQRLFSGVIGSSGIGTVGSSIEPGTYNLTIGPTNDAYDACVATDTVGVTVDQYDIVFDETLQLRDGVLHMTEPCLYDLNWIANIVRIGYQVVELVYDDNGTEVVAMQYVNDTREQRYVDLSSAGLDAGEYVLRVRSRDFPSGCIAPAEVNVTVFSATAQCLDDFATNTFVAEDDSGVSLAMILGIAIPGGIGSAIVIALGVLYYLKNRRKAQKAIGDLTKTEEEGKDAISGKSHHDPLRGDDVFVQEGSSHLDLSDVHEERKQEFARRRSLLKARTRELHEIIKHVSGMEGGRARLKQEGL